MALLSLLSPYCQEKKIPLFVAHIDHGWREESSKEATFLKKEVEGMGAYFLLKSVSKSEFAAGNWENKGREIRLLFFSEVYQQTKSQALFLGHHADDRAEGVLKRLFEGASLLRLGGIRSDSYLREMRVLRPLLSFSKKTILEFLHRENISYFSDPTNLDPIFLRGALRTEIFPFLESSFGKNITDNLCIFAEEATRVAEYFSSLNRPFLESGGKTLNLQEAFLLSEIQLYYLLKEWGEREGFFLSRDMAHGAVGLLKAKKEGKFHSKSGFILIRNGIVSICN